MTAIPLRALSLFFGLFCLLNLVGEWLRPGFGGNVWWIDTRMLPARLSDLLLACGGTMLVMYAVKPRAGALRRWVTVVCVVALAFVALGNCVTFYRLRALGAIDPAVPVPLSLATLLTMVMVLRSIRRTAGRHVRPERKWRLIATWAGAVAVAVAFSLAQMFFFGKTDYRRRADVAVVFGARVYADGRPSIPLADRVRTACGLYDQGLVSMLIFSGGPGDGEITEPEGMRRLAIRLGVPDEAIVLDPFGVNTDATVRHTGPLLVRLGARRVLAVSHFYHVPRIKMAYQRRGIEVRTVPAKESYVLRAMPYYMAREVAAMWAYYLRPLAA